MLEQDRINAMTSYLFLGPLFLLAKKGTPLAEPYVRGHAIRASKIVLGILVAFGVYYAIKPYILFPFFGISLPGILLSCIMIVSVLVLVQGAFRAYRGEETQSSLLEMDGGLGSISKISGVTAVDTDEDRTRILASLLPYFGIYLSQKYSHPLLEEGRKIGSCFTFLFALSLFFFGAETFPVFVLIALYILVFVIEGIYLFLFGRFISLHIVQSLPTYQECEASLLATIYWMRDSVKIIFGGKRETTFLEYKENFLTHEKIVGAHYFMPAGLIGIPVLNIITLPSFFQKQYIAYRYLIAQGFLISLFFFLIVFVMNQYQNSLLLLLFFPIIHIISHASTDIRAHAPIVGVLVSYIGKTHDIKSTFTNPVGKKASYHYEAPEDPKN